MSMEILCGSAIGGEVALNEVIVEGVVVQSLVLLLLFFCRVKLFFFLGFNVDILFLHHNTLI